MERFTQRKTPAGQNPYHKILISCAEKAMETRVTVRVPKPA
jgi:hypothetical protein